MLRITGPLCEGNEHPLTQKTINTESQYNDVVMSSTASQITILMIVYSTVYSGTDQRKHQSSASQAFVWGIHRWPVNSPHKGPVTRKIFPFDDVTMRFHAITLSWTVSDATLSRCFHCSCVDLQVRKRDPWCVKWAGPYIKLKFVVIIISVPDTYGGVVIRLLS